MTRFLEQLIPGYELWHLAIELAVIWLCVYVIFRFLQGTRGAGVIKGFAILLVVGTMLIRVLAQASDAFTRLNFIYDRFLGLVAILLIVVFQPELRQAMIRLGHAWSFRLEGRRRRPRRCGGGSRDVPQQESVRGVDRDRAIEPTRGPHRDRSRDGRQGLDAPHRVDLLAE